MLGRQRARLEYTSVEELIADLDEEMAAVQNVCADVTALIAETYFAAADPTAWITEGTRWMRLNIDHETGFRYDSTGPRVLQRGADDPGRHGHPDACGAAG